MTLTLRGLSAALIARVRAYAQQREVSVEDAASELMEAGLTARAAAASGGRARAEALSASARSAIARRAARARWHPSE